VKLRTRYDLRTRSFIEQNAEQRGLGIGFERITYQMRDAREAAIESSKPLAYARQAVNIERRRDRTGNGNQRTFLTKELRIPMVKNLVSHGYILSFNTARKKSCSTT
jgi:hypothetical protein